MLLRHRKRTLLFDTGGPGDRLGLLKALEQQSTAPEAIDMIVLSHLHFDHALNVELFPNADVYVHETELAYAQGRGTADLAICRWATEAIVRHPRLIAIRGTPELLEGVQVMHTPGHTDGCISLVTKVGDETWVLAQDAVKNRLELARGGAEMAADHDAARTSIERIRTIAHVVVPGHDAPLRIRGGEITPLHDPEVEITDLVSGRHFQFRSGPERS